MDQIKCKDCDFVGVKRLLNVHVKNEHKRFDLSCGLCDKKSTTINEHKEHIEDHKKEKHLYVQCKVCDVKVANISGHLNNVHGTDDTKRLKCDICGYTSLHKHTLNSHFEKVHLKIKAFKCVRCEKQFGSSRQLNYHMNANHLENKIFCDTCGFETKNRQNLQEHIKAMHSLERKLPVICDICGKSYKNTDLLKSHIKNVHKRKPLQCTMCDSVVKNLKSHMTKVHKVAMKGEEWVNCDICGKSLFGDGTLKDHRHKAHFKPEQKNRRCTYESCDFITSSVYKLNQHINGIHEKMRPFKCEVCGSTFKRKAHLEVHSNDVHSDDPKHKFQCEKCDFKTSHKYNFRNHVNAVHLGIRAYKCEFCEKTFTQRSHVRTHMKNVHIEEKLCDKRFNTAQAANIHEKGVHGDFVGDPEFSCEMCDFKTHYRDSLKNHKNSKIHRNKDFF